MMHRGERVDPAAIHRVAMFTVEGENDDISGVGQTRAAHDICTGIPADRRAHYLQPKVGHYGVFNGSRFRAEIAPRIADFIATHGTGRGNGARKIATNGATAPKPEPAAKPAPDRLQAISGIGPKIEKLLNAEGISTFAELASLKPADVAKLEKKLGFPGRIAREKWIAQAKSLASK